MFCVKLKLMERHLLRLYLLQNNNPSSKEQSQLNQVLWLGNSYTFYNDLPVMVAKLAAAQGKSVLYSNHTEVVFMCQHSMLACTVSKRVLILRTWSLIRTFFVFWVLNGSLFIFQGPYYHFFGFIHTKNVNSVCMYTTMVPV